MGDARRQVVETQGVAGRGTVWFGRVAILEDDLGAVAVDGHSAVFATLEGLRDGVGGGGRLRMGEGQHSNDSNKGENSRSGHYGETPSWRMDGSA